MSGRFLAYEVDFGAIERCSAVRGVWGRPALTIFLFLAWSIKSRSERFQNKDPIKTISDVGSFLLTFFFGISSLGGLFLFS